MAAEGWGLMQAVTHGCLWRTMCRLLNILLALLSRFLFAVHGVVTVWRVVAVKGEPLYWLLLTGVALLGVEMAVTLKCTRNAEWKWFSPMVFLYLSTVIPSIWFLELSLLQSKLPVNNSSGPELHLLAHIPITAGIVELEPEDWVAGLEQTMLIVLVLGRWLMPKGDMSRDQLSQLLMVYVGLGADILDIFDTFKEPEVKTNRAVVITGLALFSEVWSLLLTVGLQDGPFLVYRLYLMIQEQVLNQLMIFFTCKNIVIVLLELYRIFVVQCEQRAEEWGLERCTALVLWCGTQRRGEGKQEDVGREERCGEQSCHTDTDGGADREEDQKAHKGERLLRANKDREMFEQEPGGLKTVAHAQESLVSELKPCKLAPLNKEHESS
ncbi:unnamed protein product [Pleuronectes platessa]|uniref:Transmembrane protein 26 n=1 Tax=Pleuronectes platessa TaxID=8262 RepID=A0A9N7TQ45_PLEPL|nr:unnamed protein product [Pleuronectes platessa]